MIIDLSSNAHSLTDITVYQSYQSRTNEKVAITLTRLINSDISRERTAKDQ